MRISVERLKGAVLRAIKGVGNNNLLPITSMMGIKGDGQRLHFITTDGTNTLISIVDKVENETEVDVTVDADIFGKLIRKITSDSVEMEIDGSTLIVKANGVYKIPLMSDESGLVSFPAPDEIPTNSMTKLSFITNIYNTNRRALATTFENPFLTGYYVGDDMVVASDADVITFNEIKAGFGINLISPQTVNLLTLNSTEDIEFGQAGVNLEFKTPELILITRVMEGVEDYPIEDMKSYLGETFPSSCKVSKQVLLAALDRLSLFIEPYDKNGAYFKFGRRGLTVSSKRSSSVESIDYAESTNFSEFDCSVDIPQMKAQLDAYPEDFVEIHYGLENALKLTCGKVTQVISLLENEEV